MKDNINIEYFKKTIQDEINAIPDRSGNTPLTKLVNELESLPFDNEKKKKFEFFTGEISQFVNELSVQNIRSLIYFIDAVDFNNSKEVIKKYWDNFNKLTNKNTEEVEKRGLILRLIATNSNAYIPANFINKEIDIKTKYPWLWVASMAKRNWKLCFEEVSKLLKKSSSNYEELRPFFSIWIEDKDGKLKLEKAFQEWLSYLNNEDKEDLKRWAENRDISFGFNVIQPKQIKVNKGQMTGSNVVETRELPKAGKEFLSHQLN